MKLFIALPVYGGYHPHFVASLMQLLTHKALPCEIVIRPCVGDSLVARARNRLAAQFLASDCTHLLFLDTDLIFSPEHIARLISHNVPIVAGLYPKKQTELAWVCNMLEGTEPDPVSGLQPVKYAGTGCLLIERLVLEVMISAHPELRYDPDDGDEPGTKYDFFSCGVWACPKTGRRRYLSEDWWFCQRAHDLGLNVLMDTQVVLKHCGDAIYPLQPIEAFADAAPHSLN